MALRATCSGVHIKDHKQKTNVSDRDVGPDTFSDLSRTDTTPPLPIKNGVETSKFVQLLPNLKTQHHDRRSSSLTAYQLFSNSPVE